MFRQARIAVGTPRLNSLLTCRVAAFSLRPSVFSHCNVSTSIARPRLASSETQYRHGAVRNLEVLAGSSKHDTIYALSTGQGRAGIAVIRISGPACLDIYKALCPWKQIPKPRHAGVRTLYDPEHQSKTHVLDSNALVLRFLAPKTVTGEDVLELHVHGGPATVKAVLSAISRVTPASKESTPSSIIRYAEPGEFTKRAFINNRLDLSQVESLSDILDAETEQQRRAAVRGNTGARGDAYDAWRGELLLARGEIEALIDFSEDQHFDESPAVLLRNVTAMVKRILHSIDLHEMAGQRTELLRNGIRIALLGPPNVGKSSLMNLIVGREASIVSREAGTTRDIVEVSLDIRGYLCTFADTAGIRTRALADAEAIGIVEEEGIRRAKLKALDSDVIIMLASIERDGQGKPVISYDAETLQLAAKAEQRIIVVNKCDSVDKSEANELLRDFKLSVLRKVDGLFQAEPLTISCKEAETPALGVVDAGGIQNLTENLTQTFERLTSLPDDLQELLGGTERQRQLLAECRGHLEDFMGKAQEAGADENPEEGDEPDIVLAAEHLRYAANCLARITGRGDSGDVEEVLGVIFEKYCHSPLHSLLIAEKY